MQYAIHMYLDVGYPLVKHTFADCLPLSYAYLKCIHVFFFLFYLCIYVRLQTLGQSPLNRNSVSSDVLMIYL